MFIREELTLLRSFNYYFIVLHGIGQEELTTVVEFAEKTLILQFITLYSCHNWRRFSIFTKIYSVIDYRLR